MTIGRRDFLKNAAAGSAILTMEDGIVSSAYSDIAQGVGLRVVVGEQTGYAFTEDLSTRARSRRSGAR